MLLYLSLIIISIMYKMIAMYRSASIMNLFIIKRVSRMGVLAYV